MLESLMAFHFLRPWWLLGLIPLLLTLRLLNPQEEINRRWERIIAPHLLQAIVVQGNARHWFNPVRIGLVMMTLGFLVVAGRH